MDLMRISVCQSVDQSTQNVGQHETHNLLLFSLRFCRKYGLIKDRVTILSPSDFLQVIQLCLARVHSKNGKGFQTDNATVFTVAQSVCVNKMKRTLEEVHTLLRNISQSHSHDKDAVELEDITGAAADALRPLDQTPPASSSTSSSTTNTNSSMQACGDKGKETELNLNETESHLQSEYDAFLAGSNQVDAVDVLRAFLVELLNPQSELNADLGSVSVKVEEGVGCPQDPLQALLVKLLTHGATMAKDDDANAGLIQDCLAVCVAQSSDIKSFQFQSTQHLADRDTCSDSEDNFQIGQGDSEEEDLSQDLLRELFHSYLQLLVNTRSELAFAHVFNTPDRGLTHQAFTHLKHQASKKNMSLYQTAMSVIMKLRLGGRGYAPDPNNGLLEHVKGLGLLSDLMNTLQQLLEDTHCVRSSVLRVVGAIRKNLISCQSQRYKREAAEKTAGEIQRDLDQVLTELQVNSALISPDKPACQGGSLTSRRPHRVLLHYLDRCAATLWGTRHSAHHTWLHDVPFGIHTPSRFPCVLSRFRSPAMTATASPSHDNREKKGPGHRKRKMIVSTNLMPDCADVPLLQRCAKRLSDTVDVIPSKTIMHPAEYRASCQTRELDLPPGKENSKHTSSPEKKKKKVQSKKSMVERPSKQSTMERQSKQSTMERQSKQSTMESSLSRVSASVDPVRVAVLDTQQERSSQQQGSSQASKPLPKQGKKCRRRLLPPPGKGQKSITSFFRV